MIIIRSILFTPVKFILFTPPSLCPCSPLIHPAPPPDL